MRALSAEVRDLITRATGAMPAQAAVDAARPASDAGVPIGPRDAVVEGCFLMAAVDGNVSPLELSQFCDAFEAMFGDETETDVEALVNGMAVRLASDGWDRRMRAVTEALGGTELAETAYRLAASVVFVDDAVEHAEAAALDAFAFSLGLAPERTHELMAEVHADLFGA